MAAPERIGVFGGTFDPVHIGHLLMASELRYALGLARVLFAPAATSPFVQLGLKEDAPSAAEHRVAMLRLALADNPAFTLDLTDVERGGTSYTVDLLRLLQARLAPARLVFLLGADALGDFLKWREPEAIVALAELGVAARPGARYDLEGLLAALPAARGRVHVVPTPEIEISSTNIRERVATGRPITYHVPAAVERYIQEHRLYRC